MTRVEAIHAVLVEELGYQDSPTMQGEAWPLAEKVATARHARATMGG